jgi:hypothetical protein
MFNRAGQLRADAFRRRGAAMILKSPHTVGF